MIPYGRQDIQQSDIDAVVEVLQSDWITQGPAIGQFEEAIARLSGAKSAVAVNSATSALHIAVKALDVGPGDWVWTSPITFVASANCALYCGAKVDFVDIDPHTYNLSPEALATKLRRARSEDRLPKVVIPVHLSGQPCDLAAIHELSREYGFKIVEDASHAIGGLYRGNPIGNCEFSDITVFSFHPVKIITTGEGGAATTNDDRLAKRMADLRSHGITRRAEDYAYPSDGPWYYEQLDLGFNYRMTDIQAALGTSQLQRLNEFVERRHAVAKRYNELLSELPLTLPWQHPDSHSAYHLYVIRLQRNEISRSHRAVFESLREAGVGVNLHYIPVYRQPYYRALGFKAADFPRSEQYYSEAISIPMYPGLTEELQDRVVTEIQRAIEG